jgi:AcrR family transcriptional regulator
MTRGPGQRAGLTRAAVLAAAAELLAQGGSDAITMRALARRLQVAPNALYSHVPSKTALFDELLDDLLAGVETPARDVADPLAGLHALMSSSYDVLTAHPDLVPLYLARQGARGPHAMRLGEITDALLARAGVETAAIRLARRVLIVHTIGSAAFATGGAAGRTDRSETDRPLRPQQVRDSFHLSLRWLLTGIARDGDGLAQP